MEDLSEEMQYKARVAYRLGAIEEDISSYLGVSEEDISDYLEEECLSEEDQIEYDLEPIIKSDFKDYNDKELSERISDIAVDLVEEIYDSWNSVGGASRKVGGISVSVYDRENILQNRKSEINRVLSEEELKQQHEELNDRSKHPSKKEVHRPKGSTTSYEQEENSLKTLLISQRYASPISTDSSEDYVDSIEWFLHRNDGAASGREISDFMDFCLNEDFLDPERITYELALESENIREIGIVKKSSERFNKGDRLYQVNNTEVELDEEIDEFLSETLNRLETRQIHHPTVHRIEPRWTKIDFNRLTD